MYYCNADVLGLLPSLFSLSLEMLQSDVEKEGEGEKAKLLKEIQEISELVPDIESKVRKKKNITSLKVISWKIRFNYSSAFEK